MVISLTFFGAWNFLFCEIVEIVKEKKIVADFFVN